MYERVGDERVGSQVFGQTGVRNSELVMPASDEMGYCVSGRAGTRDQ